MVRYTDATKVSSYLQTTITSGTTPSTTEVETWIEEAEDEIDRLSGYSYTTSADTNVYVSQPESGKDLWLDPKYRPLVSVTNIQRNDGTDFDEDLTALSEGTDYLILNLDTARLKFAANIPAKDRALKIGTIIYGYDSVPGIVQDLATRMAAKNFLNSKVANTSLTSTKRLQVGPIGIANDTINSVRFINNMNLEIDQLKSLISNMKSFVY